MLKISPKSILSILTSIVIKKVSVMRNNVIWFKKIMNFRLLNQQANKLLQFNTKIEKFFNTHKIMHLSSIYILSYQ
jgi:hypothetical protein